MALVPFGGVQWCFPYDVCRSKYWILSANLRKIMKPVATTTVDMFTLSIRGNIAKAVYHQTTSIPYIRFIEWGGSILVESCMVEQPYRSWIIITLSYLPSYTKYEKLL